MFCWRRQEGGCMASWSLERQAAFFPQPGQSGSAWLSRGVGRASAGSWTYNWLDDAIMTTLIMASPTQCSLALCCYGLCSFLLLSVPLLCWQCQHGDEFIGGGGIRPACPFPPKLKIPLSDFGVRAGGGTQLRECQGALTFKWQGRSLNVFCPAGRLGVVSH